MSNLREFIEKSKKLGHDSCVVPMPTLELVAQLIDAAEPFDRIVIESSGRVPHEKLSLANWHAITAAFAKLK
jgi:hypothetical protein